VQRKGIVLFLGLALGFALLPGLAALWLAGPSSPGDASTALIPVAGDSPTIETQLAFGVDGSKSGCPLEAVGVDSSRF
jgi:hypothetical protein